MAKPKREDQVLELAAQGRTDAQIADTLGVSVHTVDQYWRRVRTRMGTASRTEAVAKAIQESATAENQRLLFEIAERERAEAALRSLNEELERRVAVRTEELSERIRGFYREMHDLRERAGAHEARVEMLEASGTVLFQAETTPPFRGIFVTDNFVQFGWTAQEFLDGTVIVTDFFHPEDLVEMDRMVEHFLRLKPDAMSCVVRAKARTGETRFVYEQVAYLPDGRRYGGTMADITEMKPDKIWFRLKKAGETVFELEKPI